MRVKDIRLLRAPGIPDGLTVEGLAPGLNVIVGPNASGKSTLSRVVRGSLWSTEAPDGAIASTAWAHDGAPLLAELVHGTATWKPAPPDIPTKDAAERYALDVRTLLEAKDEDIVQQIAVELAGGYDLGAAKDGFPHTGNMPRTLDNARKNARKELRLAESATEDLAEKEGSLRELRDELQAARSAGDLLRHAERALELAEKRTQLAEVDTEIARYPPGLDRLLEDEEGHLKKLREAEAGKRDSLLEVSGEIAELEKRIEQSRFPGEVPTQEEIEAQRTRAQKVVADERTAQIHSADLAAHLAQEEQARRALFSEETSLDAIPEETLRRLETHLEARATARAARAAEGEVERAFRAHQEECEGSPQNLRRAAEALRRWLRAPHQSVQAGGPRTLWPALVALIAGLVLLVYGIAASEVALTGVGGLLAGAGVILVALRLRRRVGEDAGEGRQVCREEAARTGHAPEDWNEDAVAAHLSHVEDALVKALDAERVAGRLREIAGTIAERDIALCRSERDLAAMLQELGLSPELTGLGLLQQAHSLRGWLDARAEAAAAFGRLKEAEQAVTEGLAAFVTWQATCGGGTAEDGAAAVAAVERIDGQRRDLETAEGALAGKIKERARIEPEATEVSKDLEALWRRIGVPEGDDVALRERARLRERWKEACNGRVAIASEITKLEARVGDIDGWDAWGIEDPRVLSEADAGQLTEAISQQAGRLEELSAQISGIEERVKVATSSTSLEDAQAAVRSAEADIESERERAVGDQLAKLVLEEARSAHQVANAPPMLERAKEWFSRFTHRTFRLWVEVGKEDRFTAVDVRSDASRELAELSDATRLQLLLAARLAGIEAVEGTAGPLPLCLDEVLATTDPTRFARIAETVLELTDAGRQVLYFTADHGEVLAWEGVCRETGHEPPRVVDLGNVRGDAAGWGEDLPAVPPAPPEVPAPGCMSAEKYARAIGVPPPSGHRPAGDWHLFHVLFDHLAELETCLRSYISRIGQWREARLSGTTGALIDESNARIADARADLLASVLGHWRVGRGRPVTWNDVEASGAVSATFAERVQDVLRTHGHDASAFIDAVGSLDRFHTQKLQDLEEHLEAEGILDTRETLEPTVLAQRAVARITPAIEEGSLTHEEATQFAVGIMNLLG